jgi:hypothetical protein
MHLIRVARPALVLLAFLTLLFPSGSLHAISLDPSLAGNLILYMPFEEGSGATTADLAGPNTAALLNFDFTPSSGWVDGKKGQALSFDGLNDYVSLDSSKLNLTNNFTVSAWVNSSDVSATGVFLSVRSAYQASGFRIFISGNLLVLQGQTSSGWNGVTFASGAIRDDHWHHVVIVCDTSMLTAFVDGLNIGSTNWSGDFVMNPAAPSSIGTEGAYYFSGLIDDVMIFNRSLSADEVLTLYQLIPQVFAPSAPENLTVDTAFSNEINLNWEYSSPNITGFLIKRRGPLPGVYSDIATLPASARSYSDTGGLVPASTYYYKAFAFTTYPALAYSEKSDVVYATTQVAAPNRPENLAAAPVSPTEIILSWDDTSDDEVGFAIDRASEPDGPWSRIGTVDANVSSYSDKGLSPSTVYYYRVSAFN